MPDAAHALQKGGAVTMKLGMVGLPNVGKSTLFNALTNAGAESANYPFCTIEKNVGIVSVPDARLDKLCDGRHTFCAYARRCTGKCHDGGESNGTGSNFFCF